MRRFKHIFKHEWKDTEVPLDGYIKYHRCDYPHCTARSLWDSRDGFRFILIK